jgi:hypothetical protein
MLRHGIHTNLACSMPFIGRRHRTGVNPDVLVREWSKSRLQRISILQFWQGALSVRESERRGTKLTQRAMVFVGTYTEPILFGTGKILEGKSEGIYAYSLDLASGEMARVSLTRDVPNPSFLALDPSRRFLYAVNELKEFEGAATGAVSAFSVDPGSGALRLLNRRPSHGTDPCHLQVHKTGKYLSVANYSSGSVCVLPILEDGSLGDATDVVQHGVQASILCAKPAPTPTPSPSMTRVIFPSCPTLA